MTVAAPLTETSFASAIDYNDNAWSILYGALTKNLGMSPENFQLIYPFVSWNWAPTNLGYTVAPQYDFCATVPQWSATGSYVSSGTRFNDAYGNFLSVIMANTTDPNLQQQILVQQGKVQLAKNEYDTVYKQAVIAYQAESVNNVPVFDVWLGSFAGKSWKTQLDAKELYYQQEFANLSSLIAQAQTPGLTDALNRYKDQQFYTKYQDPNLGSFPAVPAWSVSQNSVSWTQMVEAGGGNPGNLGFSMADQAYDYKDTWAKGSASVSKFFWEVAVNGQWQRIESFMSDKSLSVQVNFKAWDQVSITPGGWYNGGFVDFHKNGPFIKGYTGYKDGSSATYMWGDGGAMNLMKTSMFVAYQPTISMTLSQSVYNEFYQTWKASTGIRIGPFTFGAAAGSTENTWNKKESGQTITAVSTSNVPLIFGVTVEQLP